MNRNERVNDASSVPSSRRSRAAAVTSIRAFARIELRIVAPLRSASRRRIQTPSPRRRHRTTVVEIVSFYHTTTHFSHPSASSLTPPLSLLSSLLSPLSSRARTRASPVAPPPPPLSPPPPSPLSSPTPPPASVSATSETVLETPLAPPRPRPPRSPPRARVPRDTSLERARGTRAPTTARTRASERRSERALVDRSFDRSIDRPIERTHDRAGRWRPSGPLGAVDRIRRPIRIRIRSRDWTTRRRRKRRRDAEHGSAKSRLDRARERGGERTRGEERIARIEDDVSRKEEAREG